LQKQIEREKPKWLNNVIGHPKKLTSSLFSTKDLARADLEQCSEDNSKKMKKSKLQ